jgi:two-component system response regulator YesN
MKKLFIADDEEKVCELIQYLVDWKSLEVEIVGTANDGGIALEKIQMLKPDIVITDIRMPTYDGIELIKRSRLLALKTSFIIVSGYNQFEYAKSAISLGVENYLLKPIKEKELKETVVKIINRLEKNSQFMEENLHLKNKLKFIVQNNHETLMKKLISGEIVGQNIETVNEQWDCKFRTGGYSILILKPYLSENSTESDYELILKKFAAVFTETILPQTFEHLVWKSNKQLTCLLNYQDYNTIREKLMRMQTDFLKFRNIFTPLDWSIALSDMTDKLENAPQLYQHAEASLLNRFLEKNALLEFNKIQHKNGNFISLTQKETLLSSLETNTADGVMNSVKDIENTIIGNSVNGTEIRDNFQDLISCLEFGAQTYLKGFRFPSADDFFTIIDETFTIKDVFIRINRLIKENINLFLSEKKEIESKPIRKAKKYIREHFDEKISLSYLGVQTGFNPAYLSTLFRKETGKTYMDYLTQVRVEVAKQLLQQTEIDILDISEKVGYTDAKYFAKVFKKAIRLTPIQYREIYGQK